jgi:hypothetical protein
MIQELEWPRFGIGKADLKAQILSQTEISPGSIFRSVEPMGPYLLQWILTWAMYLPIYHILSYFYLEKCYIYTSTCNKNYHWSLDKHLKVYIAFFFYFTLLMWHCQLTIIFYFYFLKMYDSMIDWQCHIRKVNKN